MKSKITLTWKNADYWYNNYTDEESNDIEDAYKWIKKSDEVTGIHSNLLITDNQGIHIPRLFAENFDLNSWSLDENDADVKTCLEGPENEWCWEAWDSIICKAKFKDDFGNEWHLHQDGDLFAQLHLSYNQGDDD